MTERNQWKGWAEWLSTLDEWDRQHAGYTYNSSTEAFVAACDEWIAQFELIHHAWSGLDPYHIIGQRFCDWFTPSDADWIDARAYQIDEERND